MEIRKCVKTDSDYPKRLREYSQSPECLYYMGDISLCNTDICCVIGKRDASSGALELATRVGRQLASKGVTILNGMARGCDTSVLKGALDGNGKVICVMPCGLDTPYPSSNRRLYENIVSGGGCVISEYPVGVSPMKHYFLKRDLIQAMLADKLIVVDCDENGGTFYTAKNAIKYGKIVGCCKFSGMGPGNMVFLKSQDVVPITSIKDLGLFTDMQGYEQLTFCFA